MNRRQKAIVVPINRVLPTILLSSVYFYLYVAFTIKNKFNQIRYFFIWELILQHETTVLEVLIFQDRSSCLSQ